jgi:uncharacterized phiE125 gp8 family phage protein
MSTTPSGSQLRRIAGPDVEPLTLDQARAHLKLDPDLTAENQEIADWIVGARELTEEFCKQTWVESTWLLTLDGFPSGCLPLNRSAERIALPMGPVLDVVRVSYLDSVGDRQEITDYQTLLDSVPPAIFPALNRTWPWTNGAAACVEIEYRAGYASGGSPTDATGVPARVRQTMRAILAKWHENRAEVDVEDLLLAGLWRLRVIT